MISLGFYKPILCKLRTRGFILGHQDLDISFDNEKILCYGNEDAHENFKIIQGVLERGMKFHGISAVYDIAVVGALQAFQTAQISVPQEVAIIGYSDW